MKSGIRSNGRHEVGQEQANRKLRAQWDAFITEQSLEQDDAIRNEAHDLLRVTTPA